MKKEIIFFSTFELYEKIWKILIQFLFAVTFDLFVNDYLLKLSGKVDTLADFAADIIHF